MLQPERFPVRWRKKNLRLSAVCSCTRNITVIQGSGESLSHAIQIECRIREHSGQALCHATALRPSSNWFSPQPKKEDTLCPSIKPCAASLWKSTHPPIPRPKPSRSSNIGSSILPAPKPYLPVSEEYRNQMVEVSWPLKLMQEPLPAPSDCLSTITAMSVLEQEIREPDWMWPETRSLVGRYQFKALSEWRVSRKSMGI